MKKYKDFEIESRILKRIIGCFYFSIVFIVFALLFRGVIPTSLRRLIFCSNYLFLGLFIRTFFYYGFFKEKENKRLNIKGIKNCLLNYFHYGIASIAVCGLVYLASYEQIEKMDKLLFHFISIPLFIYSGFAVVEAIMPRIRIKEND
ncbi:hypothetical protein ACFL1K_05060 [Candidatus Omnitrophota bacterium]